MPEPPLPSDVNDSIMANIEKSCGETSVGRDLRSLADREAQSTNWVRLSSISLYAKAGSVP